MVTCYLTLSPYRLHLTLCQNQVKLTKIRYVLLYFFPLRKANLKSLLKYYSVLMQQKTLSSYKAFELISAVFFW